MKINELTVVQKLKLTAGMNYKGADFTILKDDGFVYKNMFAVIDDKLYSNLDITSILEKNFDLWLSKVSDIFVESIDFDLPVNPIYEYDNGVVVVDIEFEFNEIKDNYKEWEYKGSLDSDYDVVGIENIKILNIDF